MANEYVTLNELKAALTIPTADTTRDTELDAARLAASRMIDDYCGRRFYADAAATARVYTPKSRISWDIDGGAFLVDDISSTTGLVIEAGLGGSYTTVTSECEYLPENAIARGLPISAILRPVGWSEGAYDRVRVTARWGWPAVPDVVARATLITAARLWRRKDSPEGSLGSSEWGTTRFSRVDPDVATLVHALIVPGFG